MVDFSWAGDRWAHRLVRDGTALLESVEGPRAADGDPRWPRSPVLTEVSLVDAGGRSVLLGVGLAGRSHFSASIAADTDRPDTLVFEIACRVQERPLWLGSTYRPVGTTPTRPDAPPTDVDFERITAGTLPDGPLPRTVVWSYAIGPGGILWPAP